MELVYALLIILIFICLMGIIYVHFYNRLQDCKIKIDNAESVIDEALRDKYDLILNIRNIVDKKVKNNKIIFKDLDELKEMNISNFDMDRKLDEYVELINKIIIDYPDIESNEDFIKCKHKIKEAEEKITAGKRFYNDYISESNELVRKFPSNIIAKFHNIDVKNFFDNKDMNDEDINDFKL